MTLQTETAELNFRTEDGQLLAELSEDTRALPEEAPAKSWARLGMIYATAIMSHEGLLPPAFLARLTALGARLTITVRPLLGAEEELSELFGEADDGWDEDRITEHDHDAPEAKATLAAVYAAQEGGGDAVHFELAHDGANMLGHQAAPAVRLAQLVAQALRAQAKRLRLGVTVVREAS